MITIKVGCTIEYFKGEDNLLDLKEGIPGFVSFIGLQNNVRSEGGIRSMCFKCMCIKV